MHNDSIYWHYLLVVQALTACTSWMYWPTVLHDCTYLLIVLTCIFMLTLTDLWLNLLTECIFLIYVLTVLTTYNHRTYLQIILAKLIIDCANLLYLITAYNEFEFSLYLLTHTYWLYLLSCSALTLVYSSTVLNNDAHWQH